MIPFILFTLATVLGISLAHWAHDVDGFEHERARAWMSYVGPLLAAVGALGALISALGIFGAGVR